MNDLLDQIKQASFDNTLYQYEDSQLLDLIGNLKALQKKAKQILEERKEEEVDDSDEEFIEITINGQPDLIKKDIQVLNISCNNFKTLPQAIYRLKNLKKLYLFNNEFSQEEKRKIRSSFPPKVQIYF